MTNGGAPKLDDSGHAIITGAFTALGRTHEQRRTQLRCPLASSRPSQRSWSDVFTSPSFTEAMADIHAVASREQSCISHSNRRLPWRFLAVRSSGEEAVVVVGGAEVVLADSVRSRRPIDVPWYECWRASLGFSCRFELPGFIAVAVHAAPPHAKALAVVPSQPSNSYRTS